MSDHVEVRMGDCIEVMRGMPEASVDAIVTDPPAGISFMGKDWDHDKGGRGQWIAWMTEVMRECLRVAKPGAHAVVWTLPRTSHWTATAIEDAGWDVRDIVTHLFGQGFPKSQNVSLAMDKAAGVEGEIESVEERWNEPSGLVLADRGADARTRVTRVTRVPASAAAKAWAGWGTALKPAAEFWILARKPLIGTVAANVEQYGTGALNIDGTRIGMDESWEGHDLPNARDGVTWGGALNSSSSSSHPKGRWPANVVLDEEAAAMLDEQSGERAGGNYPEQRSKPMATAFGRDSRPTEGGARAMGDRGGASRFFYTAKASAADRHMGKMEPGTNKHPTAKPVALMRWLVRLVTPPGGLVLDPFAGSGTTGIAARSEGFRALLIEREPEYVAMIRSRLALDLHDDPAEPALPTIRRTQQLLDLR